MNLDNYIFPGTRVLVFDSTLFINDKITPKNITMRPATVIRRYGSRSTYNTKWIYPDLIDVKFDHRENVSHGHFAHTVKRID